MYCKNFICIKKEKNLSQVSNAIFLNSVMPFISLWVVLLGRCFEKLEIFENLS